MIGWVFFGKISGPILHIAPCCVCTGDEHQGLNNMTERFLKLEEIEQACPHLSAMEKLCKTHFTQHSTRNYQGQFMVSL